MKKFGITLVISVIVFLMFSIMFGKLSVYDPQHKTVKVTISEVETGNHLIGITEVDAILLVMIAGALIIFK